MKDHDPANGPKILPSIGKVLISGASTQQAFELIEYGGPAAPPPHQHLEHDEAFYVLQGPFEFSVGGREIQASVGDSVFIPRGTVHAFRPGEGSRALLFIVPAGLEGFFEELSAGLSAGRSGTEIRAMLAGRYDSIPSAT